MALKILPILLVLVAAACIAGMSGSLIPDNDWRFKSLDADVSISDIDGGDNLVGDFVDEDEEMSMESETSRRLLGGAKRYISYGALKKDRVPCNHRGASYYNCKRTSRANPYRRGCSAITRCARILK
ncbi:hypothetical protein AMTRI_Chr09g33780 [Amborella trichopoda]